jgi:hypothetical protein
MVKVHLPLLILNQGIHPLCKQFPAFAPRAVKSKMIDRRIDKGILLYGI